MEPIEDNQHTQEGSVAGVPAGPNADADPAAMPGGEEEAWGTMPLSIPPDRLELLQFMVADLQAVPSELVEVLKDASDHASREEAGLALVRIADEMGKVTEFFEFTSLVRLTTLLRRIGEAVPQVDDHTLPELVLRARGMGLLIEQFCATLGVGMEIAWPLRVFERRIGLLIAGRTLHPDLRAWHRGDPERVLELDGVTMGAEDPPVVEDEAPAGMLPAAVGTPGAPAPGGVGAAENESTIRIGRQRIDDIFDVIRQLVLTKNQLLSSTRELQKSVPDTLVPACTEAVTRAEQLDRLIAALRESFGDARMQSADRLLDRYQKLARDIGNITGRRIDLQISGSETRLDKFMLEELAEPLNQIVRVACHSIESTQDRVARGKPEHGTICIRAIGQGSKVVFEIEDDGDGLAALCSPDHPEVTRAVEESATELLEETCAASPYAGIGAMLRRVNAVVDMAVRPRQGTRLVVNLPVRGAVISAVLVGVADQVLAVPLSVVTEIIPARDLLNERGEVRKMANIRGRVLTTIDLATRLGLPADASRRRLAVVLRADQTEAAVVIDAVLGHQEFVVEDLASNYMSDAPVLGATIRDNGEVCMILDCVRLLRPERRDAPALSAAA